jgi:hypothetical protein
MEEEELVVVVAAAAVAVAGVVAVETAVVLEHCLRQSVLAHRKVQRIG